MKVKPRKPCIRPAATSGDGIESCLEFSGELCGDWLSPGVLKVELSCAIECMQRASCEADKRDLRFGCGV